MSRLILPYESHIRHRRLQKQCVRLGEVQPSSIATTDSEGVTPLLNGVDDNSPHSVSDGFVFDSVFTDTTFIVSIRK